MDRFSAPTEITDRKQTILACELDLRDPWANRETKQRARVMIHRMRREIAAIKKTRG